MIDPGLEPGSPDLISPERQTRAVFGDRHIAPKNSGAQAGLVRESEQQAQDVSKRLTSRINSRSCRYCSEQHLTNGVEILFYCPVRSVDHEMFAVP
jgi:hypothetical protein